MKIFRSILGIVVGWILSGVVIHIIQTANFFIYAPADGKPALERMKEMVENPDALKAWVETLPTSAFVIVLASWQLGAFIGGAVCALIAGRARLIHAGVIGGVVLFGTIINFVDMKQRVGIAHPDWLIVAGLLLPLPVSLLAGKMIAMMYPPPPSVPMS